MRTKIRFHADPTCPFSYLGRVRFDRAYAKLQTDFLEISTAPFILNPDLPANGMEFEDYLMARFGDQKAIAAQLLPFSEACAAEDIPLFIEKITIMPNTFMAQRLLYWARALGQDYPLLCAMQEAHFVKGLDLGSIPVLRALSESLGLDGKTLAYMLSTAQDEDQVQAEIRDFHQKGVQEIPLWVIGETYVVKGAQSLVFWQNVLEEIEEKGRGLN